MNFDMTNKKPGLDKENIQTASHDMQLQHNTFICLK